MKISLPLLVSMLCASVAFAEPPASGASGSKRAQTHTQKTAAALVNDQIVRPLQRAESRRSKFSRAAPVAVERRVRVLDQVAQTDTRGRPFARFAVDTRREGPWKKDTVIGCAYLEAEEVYVQRGNEYFAAESVLGEDEEAQADVCRAAPGDGALQAARASR